MNMRTNRRPELPPIPILYEDNHLLVVEKPVNLPTQEDASGDADLLNLLKEDLKRRYQKPGNVYLGLVHRLDRPVGGAMVFAKTSKAASRLSDAVRTRSFHKTYLAVVRGRPDTAEGRLTDYLAKDEKTNTVSAVAKTHAQAKEAVLEYRLAGHRDGLSLLRVQLLTGRPHQIRVQLSSRGWPLYGDQKYGARVNRPGQQIALWSTGLSFLHPVSKQQLQFTSLPPDQYPWLLWKNHI